MNTNQYSRVLTCVDTAIERRKGTAYPAGSRDKQGRWYPSTDERAECCDHIRIPSARWPWSYYVHCKSFDHVAASLHLTDAETKEARKIMRDMGMDHKRNFQCQIVNTLRNWQWERSDELVAYAIKRLQTRTVLADDLSAMQGEPAWIVVRTLHRTAPDDHYDELLSAAYREILVQRVTDAWDGAGAVIADQIKIAVDDIDSVNVLETLVSCRNPGRLISILTPVLPENFITIAQIVSGNQIGR